MTAAFPKPKDVRRGAGAKSVIRVFPGGREVIKWKAPSGRTEYKRRVEEMRVRQGGRCCLEGFAPMCPGPLRKEEATFEHEHCRGAGKHDDRVSLPDGTWINGAAHLLCNQWKGSSYIDYNRGLQK